MYSDGSKYKGEWANGRKHGRGMIISPDKEERKGIWNDGKVIKL